MNQSALDDSNRDITQATEIADMMCQTQDSVQDPLLHNILGFSCDFLISKSEISTIDYPELI